MSERAWDCWEKPKMGAMPCSVTMTECWKDHTGPSNRGTMLDTPVFSCQLRSASTA